MQIQIDTNQQKVLLKSMQADKNKVAIQFSKSDHFRSMNKRPALLGAGSSNGSRSGSDSNFGFSENQAQILCQRDQKWYKSVAQNYEEIDGLDQNGAQERMYASELDRILAEKEDMDGYDATKLSLKTVSTKKSRKKDI